LAGYANCGRVICATSIRRATALTAGTIAV
jgi:hypothetical protein